MLLIITCKLSSPRGCEAIPHRNSSAAVLWNWHEVIRLTSCLWSVSYNSICGFISPQFSFFFQTTWSEIMFDFTALFGLWLLHRFVNFHYRRLTLSMIFGRSLTLRVGTLDFKKELIFIIVGAGVSHSIMISIYFNTLNDRLPFSFLRYIIYLFIF